MGGKILLTGSVYYTGKNLVALIRNLVSTWIQPYLFENERIRIFVGITYKKFD